MLTHPDVFTMGDIARRYGLATWQVRRLFQAGKLPPAARVGAYRVVSAADLPAVEAALVAAGYLARKEAACTS